MTSLPWWYRSDEWLHNHIDPHLGRRPMLWRIVYTGPRRWFCTWADARMQTETLRQAFELAKKMTHHEDPAARERARVRLRERIAQGKGTTEGKGDRST